MPVDMSIQSHESREPHKRELLGVLLLQRCPAELTTRRDDEATAANAAKARHREKLNRQRVEERVQIDRRPGKLVGELCEPDHRARLFTDVVHARVADLVPRIDPDLGVWAIITHVAVARHDPKIEFFAQVIDGIHQGSHETTRAKAR